MADLRVIGAGVGRTGTHSLKLALEQLLGGRCYHMVEVIMDAEKAPAWLEASAGQLPDWDAVFDGYVATVDWPAASFWPELSEAYPDALVLLSTRASADEWYRSAERTIFQTMTAGVDPVGEAVSVGGAVMTARFVPPGSSRDECIAAYERHNAEVRARVPADRLVEWQPADGWDPLCAALGVDVPDEAFPNTNTTEEFRAMLGLDD